MIIFCQKKKIKKKTSGSGDSCTSSSASSSASSSSTSLHKRKRLEQSDSDAASYSALTESSSVYCEPTAVISMDVFTCTMKNIHDHIDTSITTVTSGSGGGGGGGEKKSSLAKRRKRGLTKFEQLEKKIQSSVVRKKKQLTELLQLFWGATDLKKFQRCQSLYERIQEFGVQLRRWKDQELVNFTVRNVVEPFVLVMTTQIAQVREKIKLMSANQRKKLKKGGGKK